MATSRKKIIFLFAMVVMAFIFVVYQKVSAANVPTLKEGTYLVGQTLSTWPSWSLLGNSLGVALPTDPINQLSAAGTCAVSTNRFCVKDSNCPVPIGTTTPEKCILHDQVTGWSVADRRFSFACSRDSYAYRYIYSTTTPGVYTVRAHFEDTGLPIANNTAANNYSFFSSFVSTSIFKINESSGVCNFDQEISSLQSGACGDGRLNVGEQCDPPGRIEYANGCVGTIKNLTVCNSRCQWTPSTTLCSNLSHCGNGVKEPGEICDDGNLNGKYNHCSINCTGTVANPPGSCGDSVTQPAYEVCDPGTPGKEKYTLNKAGSCSWDCQNWGPYCGDNIVQTNHKEECDGSQSCLVDGNPGVKVCTNNCLKVDRDAAAWWRFDQLAGNITADASSNANNAKCDLLANCPKVGVGKYGNAFNFSPSVSDSNPKFLTLPLSPSLTPTTSVTVEAWIFPISTSTLYQRIVENGGQSTGKGYDLEFNMSAATPTVRFNLWNVSQTSVDSQSFIALNTWTHVVGTYQRSGENNVAKIYINGVLENTNSVSSVSPIMAVPNAGNFAIGKYAGTGAGNLFLGSLDEMKIYNRVLSADAVRNNYQTGWFCAATSTTAVVTAPGTCGDNVVNTNEECDRGVANNGRACVPSYGTPCSYCSADCQNTIDVQPSQYCGNGVIESAEKCEVASGIIYSVAFAVSSTVSGKDTARNGYQELACSSEPVAPHTIKKGVKTCADCAAGVTRNCVQCGVSVNGVSVAGSVMNVLDNPVVDRLGGTTPDPLFAKRITGGASLNLAIGNTHSVIAGTVAKNASSPDLISYTLLNPYGAGDALINSDPSCSADANPDYKYQMFINSDWTRPLDFPVIAEPQPWQNDMVLSPVVPSAVRSQDLRVVVSWVGSGDFYSGVLNPFGDNPQIEGPAFHLTCIPGDTLCRFGYQYANGTTYYNSPVEYKKSGVWYHGFNSTPGQTSEEAFTIDTGAMSGHTYAFYVRSPSYPIRTFKNTAKLKVDVYLPEADSNQYHFGTPTKTYYFQAALPSDNQNARYWQVFNINAPVGNISAADILDINAIITGGPNDWNYINAFASNPSCAMSDYQSSISYSSGNSQPCYAPETQTTVWFKKTTSNCVGGVSKPASETIVCPPAPVVFTPPPCTLSDYQSSISYSSGNSQPCYAPETQTTVWSKRSTASCDGGVIQPAPQTITCPSAPVNAPVTTAPTAPQNLRLVPDIAGNGTINIAWDLPLSDGGTAITGFRVYRKSSMLRDVYVLVTVLPAKSITFSNTGLPNATTFLYQISAVNTVGEGPVSNAVSSLP